MKLFVKMLLLLSLVFTGPYGFADLVQGGQCEMTVDCIVTNGSEPAAVVGSTQPSNSSGNTITTTTTNFGTAGTAGSGAYTQAQAAKSSANTTMIAAFAMSAMLLSMCGRFNPVPCVLAGVAAGAGMMAGRKQNEAQQVMDSLGTTGTTDSASATGSATVDVQAVDKFAQIKTDLAKKGVTLNPDGSTTLPSGGTVAADLNENSLKSAGLSDSQISQLRKDLDKIKKDIAGGATGGGVEYQDVAGGATGGGYDGSRTSVDGDREVATASVEADRTEIDKDPNKWSGFSTQFGDSQIGVPQSDIFLMVEKRVDSERKIMGQ